MTHLSDEAYETATSSDPPLTRDEITAYLEELTGWEVTNKNQIDRLKKVFTFKNFKEAMQFANRITEIAESFDHHPRLVTEWGKVTVTWWTHTIRGLHKNDAIMAAKTDQLPR